MSTKKIRSKKQRLLKSIHLILVSCWLGGGLSITMLLVISELATTKEALLFCYQAINIIDFYLIIPCAFTTLALACIYAVFTKWGFFKHRWIVVKWILSILVILSGSVFNWNGVAELYNMVNVSGIEIVSDSHYQLILSHTFYLGIGQVLGLITMYVISTLKPWKKTQQHYEDMD